jgi:hypothetical protein
LQLARVAAPRLAVAAAEPPLQKDLLMREQMPQALGPQRGLARVLELQLRSRAQLVLAMARVMLTQLLERARVKQLEQVPAMRLMFRRLRLWPGWTPGPASLLRKRFRSTPKLSRRGLTEPVRATAGQQGYRQPQA